MARFVWLVKIVGNDISGHKDPNDPGQIDEQGIWYPLNQ